MEGIKGFKVLESARNEELERKYQQYVEDKIHRQKVAARKIAPGFLDTDTKILTPKPLSHTIPNGQELDKLPLQNTDFSHNITRHNRSLSAEIPLDRLTVSESSGVKVCYLRLLYVCIGVRLFICVYGIAINLNIQWHW